MGVQSGWLPDKSLSSSSQWIDSYAFLGRLHNFIKGNISGAWVPESDKCQWWQVDLGKTMKITMVATQGGRRYRYYVTSYFVSYSQDGLEFQNVTENNQAKVCGQRLGAFA